MESPRRRELLPHHTALIRIAISNGPFSVPNQSWLVGVVQVQRVEKLDSMPLGPRTRTLLFANLFAWVLWADRLRFKRCKALHGLGSLVLLSHFKPHRKFWNNFFFNSANAKCPSQNIKHINPHCHLKLYPSPDPQLTPEPWIFSESIFTPEHYTKTII